MDRSEGRKELREKVAAKTSSAHSFDKPRDVGCHFSPSLCAFLAKSIMRERELKERRQKTKKRLLKGGEGCRITRSIKFISKRRRRDTGTSSLFFSGTKELLALSLVAVTVLIGNASTACTNIFPSCSLSE